MLRNDAIKIRATQHGIVIVFDARLPLSELTSVLRVRLASASNFFTDATVKVDVGDRALSRAEFEALRAILEEEFRLRLSGIICSQTALLLRVSQEFGRPVEVSEDGATVPPTPPATSHPPAETLLIRHTCRSGFKVDYPGNIVIVGDVNPGAEIVAQNDIVVVGALRGNAHAGAGGETSALIVALAIEPKQLRIAGHLALPPPTEPQADRSRLVFTSEVAYVEGDRIVIEPYRGRFPSP